MSNTDITQVDFEEKVESIADKAQNYDEKVYGIGIEVDDCEWILYPESALRILQLSGFTPREYVFMSFDNSTSYQEVLTAMSYSVLRQEVYAELRDNREVEV